MATPVRDRRRELVDLFPQFLRRRRQRWAGLAPLLEASELARPDFFLLRAIVEETDRGVSMSDTGLRASLFNPYGIVNPIFESLPALVDKGCLAKVGERYTATSEGRALVEQAERAAWAYLATLAPLPPADLARLADTLTGIAGRLWSASEPAAKPHQARTRRLPSTEGSPPLVRLEAAVYALWMARDDAHMAAWRGAGFDGPTLELLSQLWAGAAGSIAGLIEQVRQYQRPEDVEGGLTTLIGAGYVSSEGNALRLTPAGRKTREAIEVETDRIYFTPWPPLAPQEVTWLYERLDSLCAQLLP
jgi:hypothetical protein